MHWISQGRAWLALVEWLLAAVWIARIAPALRQLGRVPDLLGEEYSEPCTAADDPEVCIIVPARDEEAAIEATLRALLALENAHVEVIAVDDRSNDATGAIMDRMAAEALAQGKRLRVLHIEELPPGWMGKTHAMAMAARQTQAKWLLFTDADVVFRPDSICRALAMVRERPTDHLVLYPTMLVENFGERMMIGCFMALSVWGSRPWRIDDPEARRDAIGVGAFNMVRRTVYEALGGFEALRMEVLEDMRLGRAIKLAGYRQRVAFGRDLIRIRWAEGTRGVIRNLSKNAFAIVRFKTWALLGTCVGLLVINVLPFAGFFLGPASAAASAVSVAALALLYRKYRRQTGISWIYAVTFPLASCIFAYTLLRSMTLALVRGGVRWRGTLYPLSELRKHAGPMW
jgi:glycosyltransferase involved in cell wall biosynthesis